MFTYYLKLQGLYVKDYPPMVNLPLIALISQGGIQDSTAHELSSQG